MSLLADASPGAPAARRRLRRGPRRTTATTSPSLIVVAVPPDLTATVVERELAAHPTRGGDGCRERQARAAARRCEGAGVDLSHYIGSHPLAGRERGGADLGARRPLRRAPVGRRAATRRPTAPQLSLVEALALDLGATPVEMAADEHDARRRPGLARAAARREPARRAARRRSTDAALALAGQGVARHDAHRGKRPGAVGADPRRQRRAGRRRAARLPGRPRRACSTRSASPDASGARRAARRDASPAATTGVARLPGKHGQDRRFAQLVVMVDDTPGQLGRLLGETRRARGQPRGPAARALAGRAVRPRRDQRAARGRAHAHVDGLEARGWRIAESADADRPVGAGSTPRPSSSRSTAPPAAASRASARPAARRLGYGYLDTGAAYRALAWHVLERGVDPTDASAVLDVLRDFDYRSARPRRPTAVRSASTTSPTRSASRG